MITEDHPLTFALTLKRWFASNGWPQKITDDWATDPGISNPHGPWASQMCGAMKAAGYNPKAEFFLALGEFNYYVAKQDLKAITNSKLHSRLEGASPLRTTDGSPYGGAEFWSLFAGLLEPPDKYKGSPELTQEDVDLWVRTMRENFRKVSLKYMCGPPEAWAILLEKMTEIADAAGDFIPPDDVEWGQEVLAGIRNPTVEEAVRRAKRSLESTPLQSAMAALLGEKESKKPLPIA